jgi:hypothetical protein
MPTLKLLQRRSTGQNLEAYLHHNGTSKSGNIAHRHQMGQDIQGQFDEGKHKLSKILSCALK